MEAVLGGAGGLHAMILIGGRLDGFGKMWFLLQNTWTSLPVFEALQSYLAHHLKQRTPCGKNSCFSRERFKKISRCHVLIRISVWNQINDLDDVAEVDDDEEDEEDTADNDLEE